MIPVKNNSSTAKAQNKSDLWQTERIKWIRLHSSVGRSLSEPFICVHVPESDGITEALLTFITLLDYDYPPIKTLPLFHFKWCHTRPVFISSTCFEVMLVMHACQCKELEKVGKSRDGSYSSFGPHRLFKEFQGNSSISEFRRENNVSWMREPQINWCVGQYWKQTMKNILMMDLCLEKIILWPTFLFSLSMGSIKKKKKI